MSGVCEQAVGVCEQGCHQYVEFVDSDARDRADFEAATRRFMTTELAAKLPWPRCTRVKIDAESGQIVEAEFEGAE